MLTSNNGQLKTTESSAWLENDSAEESCQSLARDDLQTTEQHLEYLWRIYWFQNSDRLVYCWQQCLQFIN